MTETVRTTAAGGIIYDSDIFDQAADDLFRASAWESVQPVSGVLRSAGRGNTVVVSRDGNDYVLRRYVRGGLVRRIVRDTYFFTGEDQTRAFREWRLLRKLVQKGLNVPIPAAARYRRTAMFYTAELLTVRIPAIRSLAERLSDAQGTPEFWQRLGSGIATFHQAGVFHADLNAYNVQLGRDDTLWLLDFDRGELRPTGLWKQKTLNRLHRSLQKIHSLSPNIHFGSADWQNFLEGYFSESRSS